jgi:hypothetical protein
MITVAVLALLGSAAWVGLHWIPADFGYDLEAHFETVLPDDEALAQWARSQPGVYLAHAQREQLGSRWRVEVLFGITRNGWGQPTLPDVDKAAAELGYRGPDGPFRRTPHNRSQATFPAPRTERR